MTPIVDILLSMLGYAVLFCAGVAVMVVGTICVVAWLMGWTL